MIPNVFMGTVTGKSYDGNGYMVEVFIGGQIVTYGPMHYLTVGAPSRAVDGGNARTSALEELRRPPVTDAFKSGDKVVILSTVYRDAFVIVGRYIDTYEPGADLIQVDSDGDGIIDRIEESYQP